MNERRTAISLFSSGGIGDLALRAAGAEVLVANELLEDRCALFRSNFPDCELISGDINSRREAIITATKRHLNGRELDILFATPPCQGMSKNGRGKLLNLVRAGERPEHDVRNRLVLDTISIAIELRPKAIVFENVPEMRSTFIQHEGRFENIIDILENKLSPEYVGHAEVVEFANYGVPQRRQRLITVFSRVPSVMNLLLSGSNDWLPPSTHSRGGSTGKNNWVSVLDAVGNVEPLDAGCAETAFSTCHSYHRVPTLDEAKYFWVSNTPPGKGAFDNQCVNPACGFDQNPTHGSRHRDGINTANKDTPIRCEKCSELLPRPWVVKEGRHRIMSGFTSAYKRMRGDLPASALTRNLSYACSDQKLHPIQHRVLSLHEAFILHTIDRYNYRWERADGRKLSDKTIREVIGESIPPAGLEPIFRHLIALLDDQDARLSPQALFRQTLKSHRYIS